MCADAEIDTRVSLPKWLVITSIGSRGVVGGLEREWVMLDG